MIQRNYGLHSDWRDERLDCRGNISVGNERIHVKTWPADRPRSRLSNGIVTCLIALETVELFKISECRHWVPKNDIWALMSFLLFFPSFLHQFFSFFARSGVGVGLQQIAFLSHTIMDIIPSVSSVSWRFLCNRWLRWGSIVLILRIRIIWYWRYLPCSLYQTCLVCDSALFSLGWKFYTGLTPTTLCTSGYYTYSSLMTLIAIVKCFNKNGIAIR